MKKQAIKGITLFLFVLLFVPYVGFAQDKDEDNIVLAVTYQAAFPEDGSIAEFDSLYAELDKNVVSKNKFINSVMRVGHLYGSNSRDFIVITEFNGGSLGVLEKADEEGYKLFKKWKPEKEDRIAFNEALNKYFKNTHSDEIYSLWSKVTK
jgi:hypothetical protein